MEKIKASELRIGNILSVNEDGPGVPMKIVYIGKDTNGFKGYFLNFGAHSVSIEGREDNLQPITLTPEILEKCGFEKIKHIYGYSFYTLSKSKVNRCHIDIYPEKTLWMSYSVSHCKYLHQLQNIFYCLCGTELTITL